MSNFEAGVGFNPEGEQSLSLFQSKIKEIKEKYQAKQMNIAGVENSQELGSKELETWKKLENLYQRTIDALNQFLSGTASVDDINELEKIVNEVNQMVQNDIPESVLNKSQDAYYQWLKNRVSSLSGDIQMIQADDYSHEEVSPVLTRLVQEQREFFN